MALRHDLLDPDERDAALVADAQRERAAFAPLYHRYVGLVYGYCARWLTDPTRAEDATSVVFTKALAALPRFDPDRGTFRAWLFAIAHNVLVSDYRAARPAESLDALLRQPATEPGPEHRVIALEERRELHALVERLPPEQRDAIELRLLGLKGAEIAAVLGRSHTAVKVAQHRAIKRLRAELIECQPAGEDRHAHGRR